jgi:hypothetical protein
MEVFYSNDWRGFRREYTFGDRGKARCAYPDQDLRQKCRKSGIKCYDTGK